MKLKKILLPPCSKKVTETNCKRIFMSILFYVYKAGRIKCNEPSAISRWSLITNDYIIIKFAYQLKN